MARLSSLCAGALLLPAVCFLAQPALAEPVSGSSSVADPALDMDLPDTGLPMMSIMRAAQVLEKDLVKDQIIPPALGKDGKPFVRPNVKVDTLSGLVDEDGDPITTQRLEEKKRLHKLIWEIAKGQGYSWKEQKKWVEENWDKEPEEWTRMREEAKRRNAEGLNRFTFPGTTPEESERAAKVAFGYRKVAGKWVMVDAQGQAVFNPKPIIEANHAKERSARPLMTSVTKYTKRPSTSQDIPRILDEKDMAYRRELKKETFAEDLATGKMSYKNPALTYENIEAMFPDLKTTGKAVIRE